MIWMLAACSSMSVGGQSGNEGTADSQRDDAVVEHGEWRGDYVVSTTVVRVSEAATCAATQRLYCTGRGGDGDLNFHLVFETELAEGSVALPSDSTDDPDDPKVPHHLCWSTADSVSCFIEGTTTISTWTAGEVVLTLAGGQICGQEGCIANDLPATISLTLDERWGSLDSPDRVACLGGVPGPSQGADGDPLCDVGEARSCD